MKKRTPWERVLGWWRERFQLLWCRRWAWGFKRYPLPEHVGLPGWKRHYLWILRLGLVELRRRDREPPT